MTDQERAMIVAVGNALRSQPMSWSAIDEGMKQTVIEIMRPRPSFTADQRMYLDCWWLSIVQNQLDAINGRLPTNTVVSPRVDGDGNLWLSADLFTDAVEPQMRLYAILENLLELELHYHESDYWPVEEMEF